MHSDGRWCEGVVGWEDESTPVLTIVIGTIWGTGEDIMPSANMLVSCREEGLEGYALEDVGVGGMGSDEWWGTLGNVLVLSC